MFLTSTLGLALHGCYLDYQSALTFDKNEAAQKAGSWS